MSAQLDLLISALTPGSPRMPTADLFAWLEARRAAQRLDVTEIAFSELERWGFDATTRDLRHETGRFFAITGVWVETDYGHIPEWTQPIIEQPEVGILGFLTKRFDGVLHFLVQAKMEPGNVNGVQLAPTVQATRSNYTRVHGGFSTPYLEYFLDRSGTRVLLDSLQSEQGARFLRKRNRNMVVETTADVLPRDDYCWLTLGQLHGLLAHDNVVNMDARTVISCIDPSTRATRGHSTQEVVKSARDAVGAVLDAAETMSDFGAAAMESLFDADRGLHSIDELISWFTDMKVRYTLNVDKIPLKFVKGWRIDERSIHHRDDRYFSVIAVRVETNSREVGAWTQPIVKPAGSGIVAYLAKRINGVMHFLVQGKVEPGNFDIVEMAPTVQCLTGSYEQARPEHWPTFLDYVLDAAPGQVRVDTLQSEEGGRFFQEQNRNLIVEVGDDFPMEVPRDYAWMTLGQLKQFTRFNNFVNVQSRCLATSACFV
jgi:oxidase EvaA